MSSNGPAKKVRVGSSMVFTSRPSKPPPSTAPHISEPVRKALAKQNPEIAKRIRDVADRR